MLCLCSAVVVAGTTAVVAVVLKRMCSAVVAVVVVGVKEYVQVAFEELFVQKRESWRGSWSVEEVARVRSVAVVVAVSLSLFPFSAFVTVLLFSISLSCCYVFCCDDSDGGCSC